MCTNPAPKRSQPAGKAYFGRLPTPGLQSLAPSQLHQTHSLHRALLIPVNDGGVSRGNILPSRWVIRNWLSFNLADLGPASILSFVFYHAEHDTTLFSRNYTPFTAAPTPFSKANTEWHRARHQCRQTGAPPSFCKEKSVTTTLNVWWFGLSPFYANPNVQ